LLFDSAMVRVKTSLAAAERESLLSPSTVGPRLARVLMDAAPIYRRHWWPTHDAANQLWIAALQPLLAHLGPKFAAQLAHAYGTSWYPEPMRVDVSVRAGPRLVAYTTGTTDGHVVIASTDPCDQGYAALETLFHEAGHTIVDEDVGPVGAGILAAAKAGGVAEPADLWHALMFYTGGSILKQDLADLGIPYDPESGVCDVYRGPWIRYRAAASLFWQPYLDGALPIDSALARIVSALNTGSK
jgi:hypothetical protein